MAEIGDFSPALGWLFLFDYFWLFSPDANKGNDEYGRDFIFTWPKNLKFKEGDTPDFGIDLKWEDATIYDLASNIKYYRAGQDYPAITSNMTGGEKYDLVLPIRLGERGVIDWDSHPSLNVPNAEYYTSNLNKAGRTVTFTVQGIPCVRTIDEMEVKGLTAPKIGDKPVSTGITLSTADSNPKKPVSIKADASKCLWKGEFDKYGNFQPGQHYTLTINDYEVDCDGEVYTFNGFSKDKVKVNAGTVEDVKNAGVFGTLIIGFDTPKEDEPVKPAAATEPAKPAQSSLGTGVVTPETPVALASVEGAVLAVTNDTMDVAGSSFSLLQAKGTASSKKAVKLAWKPVSGATGYVIYGNRCGKGIRFEKIAEVAGRSFKVTGLTKGTYYKYLIVAVNGDRALAVSKTIHVATKGGKAGNNTGIKLSGKKLSLKVGKSKTVKATVKKSGKVKKHRKVVWESGNVNIATVSGKGRIKAVQKGTCYVYAYTQNGICAKVKVTIK